MRCQEILRIKKFHQKLHVFFSILKEFEILTSFNFHHFFSTGTPQIPAIFFRKADDVPTILIIHPVYPHSQTKQNFCIHWINRLGGWINRVRWMPPYFFPKVGSTKTVNPSAETWVPPWVPSGCIAMPLRKWLQPCRGCKKVLWKTQKISTSKQQKPTLGAMVEYR